MFSLLSLKDDRMICIELNKFLFQKGKRKIWHLGGWQISEGQSSLRSDLDISISTKSIEQKFGCFQI